MTFNDTTTKAGILQKCEFLVFGSNYGSITGNVTRLAEFTGLVNDAMDSISSTLLDTDTRWQWDDSNYTDFPIAVTDLVNGQADYEIDDSHIKILSVEALDSTGNYYPVHPIDERDIKDAGVTPTEFTPTDSIPHYYDKTGMSIVLYPAPDTTQVTATDGLKVRYQRGGEYFLSTDTTKEPGFVSLYHKLIPLYASLDYATANDMANKITSISNKILKEEGKLKRFMTKRDKDARPRITVKNKQAK